MLLAKLGMIGEKSIDFYLTVRWKQGWKNEN